MRERKQQQGTFLPAGVHEDGSLHFRFRLRLGDGSKSQRFEGPKGLTESQARTHVATMQAQENAQGHLLAAKRERDRAAAATSGVPHEAETWDAWFARYLPTKECGESHRRITRSVATKWISPVIGTKPVRALTRDDVEDVRDKLDRALDAKEIRHSTARNAWGTLTGALKAAYAARDRSLRVLTSPLHFGILPPKRGESRQRPWLYPNEWLKFVRCADVPIAFRQICALALYTGLRPGELRALTCADVDLEGKTISISKAVDAQTGGTKAPKTAQGQRMLPIHGNLLPLLKALHGAPTDLILGPHSTSEDHLATSLRAYLLRADVKRPRLEADNATEEPIDFRSLRDTHATWLALGGVGDKVIQRRMGHASPVTTDKYIKAAEALMIDNVGVPFPPLPVDLWTRVWTRKAKTPGFRRGNSVARVGFEPTTFGL